MTTATQKGSLATAPPVAADAVLKPSQPLPEEVSQKVEGIDFDRYAGRDITVDELVRGMANTGFQATALADAVRIIDDMVCFSYFHLICFL